MEKYTEISDTTWGALVESYPIFNHIRKTDVVAGRTTFQNVIARAGEVICFTTFPHTNTPLPVGSETSKYVKRWITEASWDATKTRLPGTHPPWQFETAEEILRVWIQSGRRTYRWSQCYVINIILCAILRRLGWNSRLIKGLGTPSDTNGNGSIDLMVGGPRHSLDGVAVSWNTHNSLLSDQANFRRYFLNKEDFIWDNHYWAEVDHNNEVWVADATPTITQNTENGTYVYGPCRRQSIKDRRQQPGDVSFPRLSAIFNSVHKRWAEAGDIIFPFEFVTNSCNKIFAVTGEPLSSFYRSPLTVPFENELRRSSARKYFFKVVNGRLVQVVTGEEKFTRKFAEENIYVVSFNDVSAIVAPVTSSSVQLYCQDFSS